MRGVFRKVAAFSVGTGMGAPPPGVYVYRPNIGPWTGGEMAALIGAVQLGSLAPTTPPISQRPSVQIIRTQNKQK